MKILVVGRGSVGKKHLATLETLRRDYNLTVHSFEPSSRESRYYTELASTLRDLKIDATFVCNPTSMHIKTTLVCLRAGVHIFLEKPIAAKWDGKLFKEIQELLTRKQLVLMVGYDMRFNPWIVKTKELLRKRTIGDVWGARVLAGQYLPEWRPGSDYRKTYSAKKEMGGGVLLDLSHELDYINWLLPKEIAKVTARNINTGRLKIETEDISSIIIEYTDKSTAHIWLDYLNVPYRRSLEFYGDTGTIAWDDNAHELRLYTKKEGVWKTISIPTEDAASASIFKKELTHFFRCIKTKHTPLNSFSNSVSLMWLIGRIVQSSIKNTTVNY